MKKQALFGVAAFVFGFSLCGTALLGAHEVRAAEAGYETSNVALNKRAEFTDKDNTKIEESYLKSLHTNFGGGGEFDAHTALTNGDNASGDQHQIVRVMDDESKAVDAFAVIDLEASYTITSFGVNLWNDHSFAQVVLQVAESEDFSDAVTVFNNDTNNVMGQGIGKSGTFKSVGNRANEIKTSPVQGRYVRCSGKSLNNASVIFTEIQVFAVTSGDAPVTGNLSLEYQANGTQLKLATTVDGAKIRYTTDGGYPTASSQEYSAPISLVSGKNLIRAAAIKEDGTSTRVSDFRFDTSRAGENLALGRKPYFDEDEVRDVTFNAINRSGATYTYDTILESDLTQITDGSRQTTVLGTAATSGSGEGVWLYLDLGAEYPVDKVVVDFWHDWQFAAVVQLSTDPEFPEGEKTHTVYSNYGFDSSSGIWAGMDKHGANMPKTEGVTRWFKYSGGDLTDGTITFDTVQARYFRVYSSATREHNQGSAWSEIQVFAAETEYPTSVKPVVSSDDIAARTVPNGTTQEELELPTTVNVADYDGNEGEIEGSWTCNEYKPAEAGAYTFTFTFENDEWSDVYGLLKITVNVAEAADKQELNALITELAAIEKDTLVTESQTALEEALQAARAVQSNDRVFQSQVDDAKTALENAKSKLVYRGDKTELAAEIARATALRDSDYTAASWAALTQKLTAAQSVNNNADATQTAVDAALADLTAAIEGLQKLGDKAALEARYEALKNTQQDSYTAASWASFHEKLTNAKAVIDEEEPLEDEVNTALEQLNAAYAALVEKADFSALSEKVTAVRQLTEAEYTSSSWADLQEALTAAEAILDDDETLQPAIDAALEELTAKQAALVMKGDKTALQTLVEGLSYTADEYTADSFNDYLEAKEGAEAVLEDADASQDEIDAAKSALESAISGLKRKPNKTALNEAIARAEEIGEEGYTSESYAAFEEALEYARQVAASNIATQEQTDAAASALNAAIGALVKEGSGCGSAITGAGAALMALMTVLVAAVAVKKFAKNGK